MLQAVALHSLTLYGHAALLTTLETTPAAA